MKSTRTVRSAGVRAGRTRLFGAIHFVVLAFLAVGLTSCAHEGAVRYLYLNGEVQDPQWGYDGSEARMEVSNQVAVSAATAVERDKGMLRTDVTVTNISPFTMKVLYRGCPVQVQVFGDSTRTGEPLFDSFADPEMRCTPQEVPRSLFGMEDLDISTLTPLADILADSQPAGTYYVTAIVRPNGIPLVVPAGEVQLPRGTSESDS